MIMPVTEAEHWAICSNQAIWGLGFNLYNVPAIIVCESTIALLLTIHVLHLFQLKKNEFRAKF